MYYKIKILLAIMFMVGISIHSHAQSITDLDKKQGYFNLNLGDTYQKWSSQLETFIENGNQKSYFYKSGTPLTVYNYETSRVITTFGNQKLVSLTLELATWDAPIEGKFTDIGVSLDKLAKLINTLKSQYGNPTDSSTDENNGKVAVYWEGKLNFLLIKLTYLGVKKGSRVTIDFGNKNQLAKTLGIFN